MGAMPAKQRDTVEGDSVTAPPVAGAASSMAPSDSFAADASVSSGALLASAMGSAQVPGVSVSCVDAVGGDDGGGATPRPRSAIMPPPKTVTKPATSDASATTTTVRGAKGSDTAATT